MWRVAGLLYVVGFWWLLTKKPTDYQSYIVGLSTVLIVLAVERAGQAVVDTVGTYILNATAPLHPRQTDL